jgi:hypothetical protein
MEDIRREALTELIEQATMVAAASTEERRRIMLDAEQAREPKQDRLTPS